MFSAKIDASDLRKIIDAIGPQLGQDIAQAVADEAVIPELAKEPFRTPGKKMQFVSAKQRAFVIAAIRTGDIQVPYVRTGNIGITEKHQTTSGVDVVVPAPYSDLVRTKGMQAKFHEGTWPTTEDIAQKIESDTAELIALAYILQALEKAGLT
jgi:hypothetical protein